MPDVDLPLPFESYAGDDPYVFASYAHSDGERVFPELRALHDMGVRIWYDEGIDPGNEWPEEIARALDGASVFLVFVSPAAVASRNVRNEISFALSRNRNRPFLAIYLEDTRLPPGLALRMGDIQALMKWRMTPEHYARKIGRAFPEAVFMREKTGLGTATDVPAQTPKGDAPLVPSRVQEATPSFREVELKQSLRALIAWGVDKKLLSPRVGETLRKRLATDEAALAIAEPLPNVLHTPFGEDALRLHGEFLLRLVDWCVSEGSLQVDSANELRGRIAAGEHPSLVAGSLGDALRKSTWTARNSGRAESLREVIDQAVVEGLLLQAPAEELRGRLVSGEDARRVAADLFDALASRGDEGRQALMRLIDWATHYQIVSRSLGEHLRGHLSGGEVPIAVVRRSLAYDLAMAGPDVRA